MDKVIGLEPTHSCPVASHGLPSSHQRELQEALTDFFRRQQFCDVSVEVHHPLKSRPTVILAHRAVLAAKSARLKVIFSRPHPSFVGSTSNLSRAPSSQSNSSRKSSAYFSKSSSEGDVNIVASTEDIHSLFKPMTTLKISNANPQAVQSVMEYAYTGELAITADNIREVFDAGQAMSMNCALEKCRQFLKARQPDLALSLLIEVHEQEYLTSRVSQFHEMLFALCEERFEAVISSVAFCMLPFELIQEFLHSSRLKVHSEERVFQAVMKWLHQRRESLPHVDHLISLVRLPMLSPEFLAYCIKPLLNQLKTHRFQIQLHQAFCHHSQRESGTQLQEESPLSEQFMSRNYTDHMATLLYAFGASCTESHDRQQACTERLELGVDSTALGTWSFVSSFCPPFRPRSTVVSSDNSVYVLGGLVGGDATDAADLCEVISDSCQWRAMPPMLAPRESTAAAVHRGDVYAIGGCTAGQTLDLVERYSWRLNGWVLMAPLTVPRAAAGAASTASFVFAIGGCTGGEALSSVECFNIVDNEWHSLLPMSHKRSSPAAVILGSKLLVIGGFDGTEALSSCEAWDLTTQRWQAFPSMSRPRACAAAVIYNELVVVAGGHDGCHMLSCAEVFDSATERWTRLPDMHAPRSNFGLMLKEGSASRETLC